MSVFSGTYIASAANSIYSFCSDAASYTPQLSQTRTQKIEQTLEPLSAIVRIAMLKFYPVGTKVRVSGNDIIIQPPESYGHRTAQGVIRRLQGASIDQLNSLSDCIFYASKTYRPDENEAVQKIFRYAIEGLQKLHETYEKDERNAALSINWWIERLDLACKKELTVGTMRSSQLEEQDDETEEAKSYPLGERLKNLWDESNISVLREQFDYASKTTQNKQALKSIDQFICAKVERMREIQLELATKF